MFTERYVFATADRSWKCGPVDVYSRATGEMVVRLMQRSPEYDAASFFYKYEPPPITEGIRRVELTPVDKDSMEYNQFLEDLASDRAWLGESQCLVYK